jgi:hypothetical protein
MHLYTRLIFAVLMLLALVTSAEAGYKTYTVKENDTLLKISKEHYGNYQWYDDIQKASYIHDTHWIFVDQVIVIPDPDVSPEDFENTPLSLDEVVALNEHDPWIPRVLENPKLINHLTQRKPSIKREAIEEPELKIYNPLGMVKPRYYIAEAIDQTVIVPELNFKISPGIPSLIPQLEQPQAPAAPVVKKSDSQTPRYAPHLNWSNILQGLEEYPEEPSSKDKKKKK